MIEGKKYEFINTIIYYLCTLINKLKHKNLQTSTFKKVSKLQ